ncbi:MAG: VPLPA-CTERM sorting domain-containing protein, partial [Pseudomonadota bacterium]
TGFAAGPVDVIAIEAFNSTTSESLRFIASFVGSTFSGTELGIAITEGLARTTTLTETITYQRFGAVGTGVGVLTADTSIMDLVIVGDPGGGSGGGTPPIGGGGNGGGGTVGGGGGTPTIAPVPLPASLPLILVGLGALGLMRRRHA